MKNTFNLKKLFAVYLVVTLLICPVKGAAEMLWDFVNPPAQMTFTQEDVRVESAVSQGEIPGGLYATDNDPKIIIDFEKPVRVGKVTLDIEYLYKPGVVTAYYTQEGETDFSEMKRVVLPENSSFPCSFQIGKKGVTSLRIDPAVYAGANFKINSVTVNSAKTMGDYFIPSFQSCVMYMIFSGFALSAAVVAAQLTGRLKDEE